MWGTASQGSVPGHAQWEDVTRFYKAALLSKMILLCVPKNSSVFFTCISGVLTRSRLLRQRKPFLTVNPVISRCGVLGFCVTLDHAIQGLTVRGDWEEHHTALSEP